MYSPRVRQPIAARRRKTGAAGLICLAAAVLAAPDGGAADLGCVFAPALPKPLQMVEAVERALCASPRTRQAWARQQMSAAQLGIDRSAYLPTAALAAAAGRASRNIQYRDFPQLDETLHADTSDLNVNLTWVLFDFGLRSAHLEAARQRLNAAAAGRDEALRATFLEAAHAFYDAQSARASLDAAKSAEAAAEQSRSAAEAMYAADVGSMADRLQARTALAQAVLRRVEAEGDSRSADGTLALLMGLPPYQALDLPMPSADESGDPLFGRAVEELIATAVRTHPTVVAAQAALEAARADADAVKAQGRPLIALQITGDRSNTPILTATTPELDRTATIGIQITVPLFEGFSREYKVRQALAAAAEKEADVEDAQRRVGLSVWKDYQDLRAGSENINASRAMAETARQSREVAQGRYRSGVGSLLELLKAQSDSAGAEQQRLAAILRFQTARLRLAADLGELDAARRPDAAMPVLDKREIP